MSADPSHGEAAGGWPPGPSHNVPFVPDDPSTRQDPVPRPLDDSDTPRPTRRPRALTNTVSPVRRKPLPQTASPLAIQPSPVDPSPITPRGSDDTTRSLSIGDSPTTYDTVNSTAWPASRTISSLPFVIRNLDSPVLGGTSQLLPTRAHRGAATDESRSSQQTDNRPALQPLSPHERIDTAPKQSHVRLLSDPTVSTIDSLASHTREEGTASRPVTMSLYPSKPQNLKLSLDADSRSTSNQSDESYDSTSTSKPKSPSKFGAFFGWKSSSPGANSSTTSFSDKTTSPLPSPLSPKPPAEEPPSSQRSIPAAIDTTKANTSEDGQYFTDSGLEIPPITPDNSNEVDEMEDELRQISSELASSIRREMDLEDLVDRLQAEANAPPGGGRRTSDYFSDSGNSSVRALSDSESKHDEMEKSQRKMEQQKAQLQLDLTQRVQEERTKRKVLESQVRSLEQQVQRVDYAQLKSSGESGRVKELESSLEDLRRKLSEERQVKENFEDLLTALRGEIQESRNERDNLRDEVVPNLRARVEGLESEAAEFQRLQYENTRMQQDLQTLKNENNTLITARKMQLDLQQQGNRINSITEEGSMKPGLSRANSVARSSMSGSRSAGGLNRSGSLKERESRESLAERVKDIEAQRDALHRALKSLLERQEHQNRENQKRIRTLEEEKKRLQEGNPKRMGYDREVSRLREEINHLRRRADEALEQKWQCEKGLSGLKMDLDRAEQETASLRTLLQEHDILVPDLNLTKSGPEIQINGMTTSASLEKAYQELRATHSASLSKIRELEARGEAVQKEAEEYRMRADALQDAGQNHMSEETTLAGQLRASAARVEELAVQVRQQLASNNQLRERLADAVRRGDRDQKASASKITQLQARLKTLEDEVTSAQNASEDMISKHEEEIRVLKESHNAQLQRMKAGMKSVQPVPNPALSPLFTNRTPKIDKTTSGNGVSINEASRADVLQRRVEELEKALANADKEMEEVVGRMSKAQMEVMELQSERDEAMRATRKLQQSAREADSDAKALIK